MSEPQETICRLAGICYIPPAQSAPLVRQGRFVSPAGWVYIALAVAFVAGGAWLAFQ
ncbi:MAG TPA: hypothetical protein VGF56_05945 [Rhizomicrobium sp.]|jgi:hypothetical protein